LLIKNGDEEEITSFTIGITVEDEGNEN